MALDKDMRFKLLAAYKGTEYKGWQIQEKTPEPPTIQGSIEKAINKISGLKIRLYGAGRTDSGVHAIGQCAHFDLPDAAKWRNLDWRHALNALLPSSIRIISYENVCDTFHARKDAILKTYTYDFWTEDKFLPPQYLDFVWNSGPLDLNAMRACAMLLCGEHDFSSFQNAGTNVESTRRKIYAVEFEELPHAPFYPEHAPYLRMSISANGFLKQMARNIAGFLREAGRGKISVEEAKYILNVGKRQLMPAPTAPAKGLCLAKVYYDYAEAEAMLRKIAKQDPLMQKTEKTKS